MNREIKFRVWDKAHECYLPDNTFCIINLNEYGAVGIMIKDFDNYTEGEYLYPNAQIVEEFTGMHDKNGKEIYEGDIVEWHRIYKSEFSTNPYTEYRDNYEVVWMNDYIPGWYLKQRNGKLLNGGFNKVTVIGNIHQNPELLNK